MDKETTRDDYLAVLGSWPRLSLAEVQRLDSGAAPHGDAAATFRARDYTILGGSSKVAEIIEELPTTRPADIRSHILEHATAWLADQYHQKVSVGVSIYGANWPGYKDFCFSLKKQLKASGFRPRIVLGHPHALNSAQVLHNGLHRSKSEFIISIGTSSTCIGRTVWVQDVDLLSKRDMQRPCRDMDVGMLPPKLARIMVNLAGGSRVFDPFCGSGVILQEALLMDKQASGSDIDREMVDCSRRNLDWLEREFNTAPPETVFTADARHVTVPGATDAVVSESYLGPIINASVSASYLQQLAAESDSLVRRTLENLQPQLPTGTPVCLAVPAWWHPGGMITPPLAAAAYPESGTSSPPGQNGIDDPRNLGYNRIDLHGVSAEDLVYRRHDQYVGRQLMLLETI